MRLSKLLVQFFSEHVEKKQRRGLMCWTMPVEFSMNRETTRWLQRERLGGVKRAGACWFIKTSPCTRPAVQHTRLQEWGHHEWLSLCDNDCSTQRRGNGQRSPSPPRYGQAGVNVCVWECVYTEKLLRNVRIHAKERIWVAFKGTLLSLPSEEISQPHQKAWPDSHSGWN